MTLAMSMAATPTRSTSAAGRRSSSVIWLGHGALRECAMADSGLLARQADGAREETCGFVGRDFVGVPVDHEIRLLHALRRDLPDQWFERTKHERVVGASRRDEQHGVIGRNGALGVG